MTKKEAKKFRCCEAARLAAKTMAAIQQSWPARADQSPTGALIAAQPRLRGCSLLRTSKRWSRSKKAKATPHNSKCRCGEREVQAAKQKAQIILDVLSSIFATQIVLHSRSSGA